MISWSNKIEENWLASGWAFRQVLDDTLSQHPDDAEMAAVFDRAKEYSGLSVELLEPQLASRVTGAIWEVVKGILSGATQSGITNQPYGDDMTVEQYRRGLQALLEAFPSDWKEAHADSREGSER